MSLEYCTGDLLDLAPHPSLIAHSCNTRGLWTGGFAYQLSLRFPRARDTYEEHCHNTPPSKLIGTSFLIRTHPDEPGNRGHRDCQVIVCLFTSIESGSRPDPPKAILENTRKALDDLNRQLISNANEYADIKEKEKGRWVIDMPKINSGIFNVKWQDTALLLSKYDFDFIIYVID